MNRSFDPDLFLRRIGERLVDEFRDARAGTTPATVGSAAEQPVRDQLDQILPRGIGVGEGFVIDSYGNTSRQQDVILYERDICPVFSVNNTPQTTYYPCEGVIAVGEVKTALDKKSLGDAFEKIASVKGLQRHAVHHFMPNPTTGRPMAMRRDYLMYGEGGVVRMDDDTKADERERLGVFGFVLAGESRLRDQTLLGCFREHAADVTSIKAPNIVLALDGCAVRWAKIEKKERREVGRSKDGTYMLRSYRNGPEHWSPTLSAETATHVISTEVSEAFRMLVRWLRLWARVGRTSAIQSFDRYFEEDSSSERDQLTGVVERPLK